MKCGLDLRQLPDLVARIRKRTCPILRRADVTKRGEFLLLLGIDELQRSDSRWKRFQIFAQSSTGAPIAGDPIARLAGIADDVVQLRTRTVDVLIATADQRPQLA